MPKKRNKQETNTKETRATAFHSESLRADSRAQPQRNANEIRAFISCQLQSSRLGHVENSFFMSLFSALLFYSFFFSRLIFFSSFSSLLLLFLFFLFYFFSPLLFVLSFSLLSPIRHRWKFIKFISLARYNFTSSEQTLVEVTSVQRRGDFNCRFIYQVFLKQNCHRY